jgi:hypothetical protein
MFSGDVFFNNPVESSCLGVIEIVKIALSTFKFFMDSCFRRFMKKQMTVPT